MKTLLLAVDTWDLCLDANGNLAIATEPYQLAQDVASAIRTVLGEVYYDTTQGVDYFGKIFGKTPPTVVFQDMMVAAALTVTGVVSAVCVIESFIARTVKGQVDFVDSNGTAGTVSF